MLALFIQALIRRPTLVASQIETYGQIAIEELALESQRFKRWALRSAIAGVLLAVGLMLGGMAALLWAVQVDRMALLWIVPLGFLLASWMFKWAAGPDLGPRFPVLRQQLSEDRAIYEQTKER